MKRILNVLSALTPLLCALTLAAPRVADHGDYARVVFNLPATTSYTLQKSGNGLDLHLNTRLPTDAGPLNLPEVSAYSVSDEGAGSRIHFSAATPLSAQVSLIPAGGGQPIRLVVDLSRAAGAAATAKTAPASTAAPAPSATLQKVVRPQLTVVIDPGHGGVDSGMVSPYVTEKVVTLDVGLKVRRYLQGYGIRVIMTRASDTQISVNKRDDLDARSRLANVGKVNAYVSIHVNSAGSSAQGIETYYFGQPMGGDSRSLALRENGGGAVGEQLTRQAAGTAQNLVGDLLAATKLTYSRQLAGLVEQKLLANTGAVNRGVKSDIFYVIKNPTTPAILTEIGFGTNPTEGRNLASDAYRDRVAHAIADAIAQFLHAG